MKNRISLVVMSLLIVRIALAQSFGGAVNSSSNMPLADVKVYILEDNKSVKTDGEGLWSYETEKAESRTFVFSKAGYAYTQILKQRPSSDIDVILNKTIKSAASIREENYISNGCEGVEINSDKEWDVSFMISELKGDLAPDNKYTRRDPSAVIKVDDTYYIYYSYSLTFDEKKMAPWDLNDIYYSTSTDGIYWEEKGVAVGRGEEGSFDHRSVFTTEVLAYKGAFYLVYQAAADKDGIYNRNVVGMAQASSPNGPWTKLEQPVLHPTYTDELFFDNNAVHDPCIVPFNGKFHLYYKGECNCQNNDDCVSWCNPVCGLKKQVKWGVAIANYPTGPYKKSVSNPITNTGHEVMVWPYKNGIAILQHQDGPEANSIQFAENGIDFKIMGSVKNIPEAAGLNRSNVSNKNPHEGVSWGVGHKLMWNAGPRGWMYIYRFDAEN